MTRAGWIAAAALGVALGAVPFLRYLHLGHGVAAHVDHAPRHGGVLRMIGDHHLELVRREGRVELHASDGRRQPVRITRGWVEPAGGARIALDPARDRATAPIPRGDGALAVEVELADGTRLAWRFRAAER